MLCVSQDVVGIYSQGVLGDILLARAFRRWLDSFRLYFWHKTDGRGSSKVRSLKQKCGHRKYTYGGTTT